MYYNNLTKALATIQFTKMLNRWSKIDGATVCWLLLLKPVEPRNVTPDMQQKEKLAPNKFTNLPRDHVYNNNTKADSNVQNHQSRRSRDWPDLFGLMEIPLLVRPPAIKQRLQRQGDYNTSSLRLQYLQYF